MRFSFCFSLHLTYIRPVRIIPWLSRAWQTVIIMNQSPAKMKTPMKTRASLKYPVNDCSPDGQPLDLELHGPAPSTKWIDCYQSPQVLGTWDAVATREVTLAKNLDLKVMQVNILKSVTRVTKRGGGIRTDLAGRQCLDASVKWRGCNEWTMRFKAGWQGWFDFVVTFLRITIKLF